MKVLVLGRGKSGTSAGKLLNSLGFEVDYYEDGSSQPQDFSSYSLAVKSPGFPPEHAVVKRLLENGVSVYGEVELAYRFSDGFLISITGTNGKSTTTALVYNVLKQSGFNSFIGGNYGIPFSDFALKTDGSTVSVLELSSFQIEDLASFRSDVSAILNVTPDHLNRYSDFESYLRSKLKLIDHSDLVVLNKDDKFLKDFKGKKFLFFSRTQKADAFYDGSYLISGKIKIPCSILPLKGVHNIENYLASLLILREVGLTEDEIVGGFLSFKGLPHRTEFVGEVRGVKFINDSKSTNVDSLRKALESFENVVLIAGGKDKGLDFSSIKDLVSLNVKFMVVLGESADKLFSAFSQVVPIAKVSSLEEAVLTAFERASEGDVVLFSPGCASFDMFRNFEERGEAFKRIVKRLEERFG